MSERPILFSGTMVRAILDGRKTQERRVAKLNLCGRVELKGKQWHLEDVNCVNACPCGKPGDRLWVRESWSTSEFMDDRPPRETKDHGIPFWYSADGHCRFTGAADGGVSFLTCGKLRPSIHMPRWASRINLEITGVRVERLQDISRDDAIAEGIEREYAHGRDIGWKNYLWHGHFGKYGMGNSKSDAWEHQYSTYSYEDPAGCYSSLWESINGPGSWDANPWVWVVEFKRVS